MWHRGQLINLPLLKVISSVRKKKKKKDQSATMALHGCNSSMYAFKLHEPATFLVGANPSSFLSHSSETCKGCGSEGIGSFCLTGASEKICLDLNKKSTVSVHPPRQAKAQHDARWRKGSLRTGMRKQRHPAQLKNGSFPTGVVACRWVFHKSSLLFVFSKPVSKQEEFQ